MENKSLKLLEEMNNQIIFLESEIGNTITRCEKIIEVILCTLEILKKQSLKYRFQGSAEEIKFFKVIKPKFTSKLIYYNSIYKIETKKPFGSHCSLKKYYNNQLLKLKRYFDNNIDFYKYYRTSSTYLDYKFFVRNKFDVKLYLDNFYFETDSSFCTSHDFKVAKILAYDLLQLYIEDKLIMLNQKKYKETQLKPNAKITWTGSKVALTELIYALQTEGVFNNGAAGLKEIAEYFQEIFNIDLRQYRRTFLEIRTRQENRARFISSLKNNLLKRMDNADY